MFNFFRKPQPKPPTIGERWVFHPNADNDPFPPKGGHDVKILDVKQGWVRYSMGRIFKDERATIEMFTHMYKRSNERIEP